MDILCPRCGEPYEVDAFHDNEAGLTFTQAVALFKVSGCGPVFGATCVKVDNARTAIAQAVIELNGDDVDGMASDLEDAEWLGFFREEDPS